MGLTLMGTYLAAHALTQQPRRLQAALAHLHDPKQRLQLHGSIASAQQPAKASTALLPSLSSAIALSDQQLSPQAHTALCALAIFPPKPASFSEDAALAVIQQPVEILDELWDAGLLESCGAGHYCLHQTIVDYARALADMPAAQEPQTDALTCPTSEDEQQLPAPIAVHLFHWQISLQKQGQHPFGPSKLWLRWSLLIISLFLLATIIISLTLPHAFIRQTASTVPTSMRINYGPPLEVQCPWAGWFNSITLPGLFMSNLTVQADMTILSGDGGGLIIRSSSHAAKQQYRFRISPDTTYDLVEPAQSLASGSSLAIKPGLNQTNHLTIIAQKHTISVYINAQFLLQTDDSTSSYGTIAGMAYNRNSSTDEVLFKNIQVS